jgi:AraC-like DNA-binding protein
MKSDQEFVDKLIGVVKRNYTNANFDIVSMAAEMSISDRQLQRKVKALTGQSPVEFLRQFRLEESLRHLREGVPVGEAANAYFTSCFRARYGVTPIRLQATKSRRYRA